MSTQYGTLSHRKTLQVPMWLIVALVVGMLAVGVAYTIEQYQGRGAVATSTVKTFPGGLETSGVIPKIDAGGPAKPIVINGEICHQCR